VRFDLRGLRVNVGEGGCRKTKNKNACPTQKPPPRIGGEKGGLLKIVPIRLVNVVDSADMRGQA